MNPEEEITLARDMLRIKKTWFDDYFKEKKKRIMDSFLDKDADLEDLHYQLMALEDLRIEVQNVMDTGRMAQQSLETTNN